LHDAKKKKNLNSFQIVEIGKTEKNMKREDETRTFTTFL